MTVPIIGGRAPVVLDAWTTGASDTTERYQLMDEDGAVTLRRYSFVSCSWEEVASGGSILAERLARRTEELRLDRQRIVLFAAALARSIGLAETLSFEVPSGFTRLTQRHHEALLRVAVAVGLPLEQWKVKVPEGLTPDPETAEVARRLGIVIQERGAQ